MNGDPCTFLTRTGYGVPCPMPAPATVLVMIQDPAQRAHFVFLRACRYHEQHPGEPLDMDRARVVLARTLANQKESQ